MFIKPLLLLSLCNIFLFAGALDDFQQSSQKKITEAIEKEKKYEERLNNIPLTGQINSLFELKQHINKNFKGDLQVNSIINLGGESIVVPNKINGNGQGGFTNGKINFKHLDNVILDKITLIGGDGTWNPSSKITNSKLLNRNYTDGGDLEIVNCKIDEFGPPLTRAKDQHIVIKHSEIKLYHQVGEYYTYAEDTKFGRIKSHYDYYNYLQLYKCVVDYFDSKKQVDLAIIENSVIKDGTLGSTNSFTLINSIATVKKVFGGIRLYSSNIWTEEISIKNLGGAPAHLYNSILYINKPGDLYILGSKAIYGIKQSIFSSKVVSPKILKWEGTKFTKEDYENFVLPEKLNKADITTWGTRFPNGERPKKIHIFKLDSFKRKPDIKVDLFGNKRSATTNIGAIDTYSKSK